MVDNVRDDELLFAPERCGGIAAEQLVGLCFSGKYDRAGVMKLVRGRGGLLAHLGTSDAMEVERRMARGDERARLVYDAMLYTAAKSIGVELPDTKEELEQALRHLLAYGNHVVVEKKIHGREIQIAVLGDKYLPAVEIIPQGEFFDYVSKYQAGGAKEICPAPITDDEWKQVGEMALALHRALGLSVYSRSDFILDDEGKAWCLEINTLPGMTPTSLVPQEAAQVGLSYAALCEQIIHDSLEARKAAKL